MTTHDLTDEPEAPRPRPLRRPPKEDLLRVGPSVDFSERPPRPRALRLSPSVLTAAVDRGISGRVVDVSVTGLVLEHGQSLRPGMISTLTVAQGETVRWTFRAQVIRSQVIGSVAMLGVQELLYQTGFTFLEGPAEEMWGALTRSPGGSLMDGDCVTDEG